MKALRFIYAVIVGTLGGILGITLLGILWACNTLILIGEDIARAIVNRKS